jgi:hypothetical protein
VSSNADLTVPPLYRLCQGSVLPLSMMAVSLGLCEPQCPYI